MVQCRVHGHEGTVDVSVRYVTVYTVKPPFIIRPTYVQCKLWTAGHDSSVCTVEEL